MLGNRVLNAEDYPNITVTGAGLTGEGSELSLDIAIELMGRVVELRVPTKLELDRDNVEATGAFHVGHSALGMRPFTALMGMLRVAEQIDIKYRVRARAVQ